MISKKEVIAFANTNGGKLYVGIDDDGTIIGLDDIDACALQISNMIRDCIKPDVTMFLHCEAKKENDKKYLEISVQRGTDRPYYIAKKECVLKAYMLDKAFLVYALAIMR